VEGSDPKNVLFMVLDFVLLETIQKKSFCNSIYQSIISFSIVQEKIVMHSAFFLKYL